MAKRKKRDEHYCTQCGSTGLLFEARAEWDLDKQKWTFWMEGGCDAWCPDCGLINEWEFGDPADWCPDDNEENDDDDC